MCGIIASLGNENMAPRLIAGLKKLEYRGYDSAGIAVIDDAGALVRVRAEGKIARLEQKVNERGVSGNIGIGHTRWATHGAPVEHNAHPHFSPCGRFAVVHNGIIENAAEIRATLLKGGVFTSETDTEVIAHLLQKFYEGDPLAALAQTCGVLRGSWALAVLCTDAPDTIFGAASGSPLLAAQGERGAYLVSDPIAIAEPNAFGCRLNGGELCAVTKTGITLYSADGAAIEREPAPLRTGAEDADKGAYEHHMLHEIMQQPAAVANTLRPLLPGGAAGIDPAVLPDEFTKERLKNVVIVACGSAYHTGLAGAMLIERMARIPARAEIASEFRYADPILTEGTLAIFVSQSGETADTLAALRLAKERGARVLSIVNVPDSAIAAASQGVIYTKAGREIAVATTKAYSAQLAVFYALALHLGTKRGTLAAQDALSLSHALAQLPDLIEQTVASAAEPAKQLAAEICERPDLFFIGRQLDFATATEGSLKIKEISYLNAQAYAAGELKHGTISLVEPGTPVIAVATQPDIAEKTHSNLSEVRARGAKTVVVTSPALRELFADADFVFTVPETAPPFMGSLAVLPLQLLAYETAKRRGCDIDQPKNLAKSVTVE